MDLGMDLESPGSPEAVVESAVAESADVVQGLRLLHLDLK